MRKVDYRHYISLFITLIFVALGIFVFPNAICRLLEALRDFFVSLAYYFFEVFGLVHDIVPTVNDYPAWQIAESRFQPLTLLPFTWEEFQVAWKSYWERTLTLEMLQDYTYFLCDT